MAAILVISIVIRLVAMLWSIVLWRRLADWRMGLLTATLALMAAHQIQGLRRRLEGTQEVLTRPGPEIPALVVSILVFLFVILLERVLQAHRQEIVDRLAVERALLETESQYSSLSEGSGSMMFSVASDGTLDSVNPAFTAATGWLADEWLGKGASLIVHPDERQAAQQLFHEVMRGGVFSHRELRISTREGRYVAGDLAVIPRYRDGRVVGALGVARDITERRRTEEAMRRVAEGISGSTGEAFFQSLVTHLANALELDMCFVGELAGGGGDRIRTIANCAHGEIHKNFEYALDGSPCETVAGQDLCCYPEGVSERFPRDSVLAAKGIEGYIGALLFDSAGRSLGLMVLLHEEPIERAELAQAVLRIYAARASAELERMHTEAALKTSEEKYRGLFEDSQDAIYISSRDGRILDINPAGATLFGFESKDEMMEVDVAQDLYLESQQRERLLAQLAEQGFVRDLELELRRRDDVRLVVLATAKAIRDGEGRLVGMQGILRDVTEQRELEQQLRQSQRMEAVGRLAGGVAHDFNNLLTVINGHSSLALERLSPEDPIHRELLEIKAAGERAAALTRELLVLSRRQVVSPTTLDLNQLVLNMQVLLRRVIGEHIELDTQLDRSLPGVLADSGQMEQVLLNLAVNARDAMTQGGRLSFETRAETEQGEVTGQFIGLAPGEYVVLRVQDSGVGIPKEIRDRIFEPFFTTKEPGVGTGLGLATVYSIIEQSGGRIRVDSETGAGTKFEIVLPSSPRSARPATEEAATAPRPGGSETILLAEDETAVRSLLERCLVDLGYRVLAAANGEEALELAATGAAAPQLLVTDLVMPGMSGFDLADRLSQRVSGLKILFMSGYTEEPGGVLDSGLRRQGTAFLQKPFSTDVLAQRVRAILDERVGGPTGS